MVGIEEVKVRDFSFSETSNAIHPIFTAWQMYMIGGRRSYNMSRIRSRNTKPEMLVRRLHVPSQNSFN